MFFLHRLNLRQKLLLLMGLLLLLAAVSVVTQWQISKANQRISQAHEARYASFSLATELRHSSDDLTRLARTYVVTGDARWEQQYNEVLAIRSGQQPRPVGYEGVYWDFRAADAPLPQGVGQKIALLDMMKLAGFSQEEFAKLEQATQRSTTLVQTETQAMQLVKSAADVRLNDPAQAAADLERARAMLHGSLYHQEKAKIMEPIQQFFQLLDARTSNAVAAAEKNATWWLGVQIVSSATVLGVLFTVLYSILNNIIAALRSARRTVDAVSKGDLTQSIRVLGDDEIGRFMASVRQMQLRLEQVVSTVRHSSDSVAHASAEIAQGNQDLSARTESQASALEQTSAAVEQLTSTVQQNASNAQQANQLARAASTVAEQGGEVMTQVVSTMQEINDSARRITDIIAVIDGIAFQTNILALNAAVEAARAGEQGRGFAVVASEVRALAGRSADAAKEIKRLISQSVDRVEDGSALVDRAGQTMQEVVHSIRRVTDIMGEISAASQEQDAGMRQVSEAVTQIDQSTQQNAALVEEMAAAASSVKQQAQELVQSVAVFKLHPQASAATAAPAAAAPRTLAGTGQAPAALKPAAQAGAQAAPKATASVAIKTNSAVTSKATPKATPKATSTPAPLATFAPSAPAGAPSKPTATTASDDDWETF